MAPLTWTLCLRVLLLFFRIKTRSSHRLTIWERHNVLRTEVTTPFGAMQDQKKKKNGAAFRSHSSSPLKLSLPRKEQIFRLMICFYDLCQNAHFIVNAFIHPPPHSTNCFFFFASYIRYGAICRRVWVEWGRSVDVVAGINFVYISTDVICNESTNPLKMFDES